MKLSFDKLIKTCSKTHITYLSFYIDDDVAHVWLEEKEINGCAVYEYYFGEFVFNEDFDNVIDFCVNQVKEGFVRCEKCHKWIKKEDAKTTCPAGCYCKDCYGEKEITEEREFLSCLD